jgi:tellurite resistance protein TerC
MAMPDVLLFPFAEYWWFYAGFTALILGLLALDLGVFHRQSHAVGFREALAWTGVWLALALAFNYGLYRYALARFPDDPRLAGIPGFDAGEVAWQVALEFLAGYVVEYSLAIDNIFVFVLVLGYFAVPADLQHRVLFYGILGALAFRAVFIALGAALMQVHWVVWVFGAFLIFTGIKMMLAGGHGLDPDRNVVVRLFRRVMPLTPAFHGERFFVRIGGRRFATPLFLALLFLELSDVVFAVDSVPAIYALTDEPLIVFTSNVFAILGLRSLYFVLGGAVDRFHLLRYGLALVLVFVGLKMVWLDGLYGGKFPIGWSLGIIGSVIATSVVLSLLVPRRKSAAGLQRNRQKRGAPGHPAPSPEPAVDRAS